MILLASTEGAGFERRVKHLLLAEQRLVLLAVVVPWKDTSRDLELHRWQEESLYSMAKKAIVSIAAQVMYQGHLEKSGRSTDSRRRTIITIEECARVVKSCLCFDPIHMLHQLVGSRSVVRLVCQTPRNNVNQSQLPSVNVVVDHECYIDAMR